MAIQMAIQVLVISEIRFFREGLATWLDADHRFGVDAAAAPAEAIRVMGRLSPDVVLVHMSVPDGPELIRALRTVAPRVATIALGVAEDEGSVVAWAEAGIAGYVPADGSMAQVADAVQLVAGGAAACPAEVAAVLLRRVAGLAANRTTATTATNAVALTAREAEVARLVQSGLSNQEISRRLTISLPTVKNHVHHILGKLKVDSRSMISLGPDP